MSFVCYNSYLEVNLRSLSNNIDSIRQTAGNSVALIPVLKGNAYGVGAAAVAKAICACKKAELIAVAQVGEAVELLRDGITSTNFLTLGGVPASAIPFAVEYGIRLTVYNIEIARQLSAEVKRQGKSGYPVHLKIETGLNRIGIKPGDELDSLAREIKSLGNLEIEGAFTHFIDGEIVGSSLAQRQFSLYNQAVGQLKNLGVYPRLLHVCNSGAFEWYPQAFRNAVRIGRRLYMDAPSGPPPTESYPAIKEVCSLRSVIVNLRTVRPGETVGYDEKFTACRLTRVAVVCVGYGDGIHAALADVQAPVLVGEKQARLIGVCMDQCLLDVTDISCGIGDEVTFFGYSSGGAFLSAQRVASLVGHEGVYFTSQLSNRVKRIYLD